MILHQLSFKYGHERQLVILLESIVYFKFILSDFNPIML